MLGQLCTFFADAVEDWGQERIFEAWTPAALELKLVQLQVNDHR